jgi:hypothetical protein
MRMQIRRCDENERMRKQIRRCDENEKADKEMWWEWESR